MRWNLNGNGTESKRPECMKTSKEKEKERRGEGGREGRQTDRHLRTLVLDQILSIIEAGHSYAMAD